MNTGVISKPDFASVITRRVQLNDMQDTNGNRLWKMCAYHAHQKAATTIMVLHVRNLSSESSRPTNRKKTEITKPLIYGSIMMLKHVLTNLINCGSKLLQFSGAYIRAVGKTKIYQGPLSMEIFVRNTLPFMVNKTEWTSNGSFANWRSFLHCCWSSIYFCKIREVLNWKDAIWFKTLENPRNNAFTQLRMRIQAVYLNQP